MPAICSPMKSPARPQHKSIIDRCTALVYPEAEKEGRAATLCDLRNKLLEQTRTGSIEVELEDNALEPGDVAVCLLPELGYKATVRVANIITQSQMDGTTRTVRLGTPVWKKI